MKLLNNYNSKSVFRFINQPIGFRSYVEEEKPKWYQYYSKAKEEPCLSKKICLNTAVMYLTNIQLLLFESFANSHCS